MCISTFGMRLAIMAAKYSSAQAAWPASSEPAQAINASGGGGYTGITFSVAYARAMMQAALESV